MKKIILIILLSITISNSISAQDELTGNEYYNRAFEKVKLNDFEGGIRDYTYAIDLNCDNLNLAYFNRGVAKQAIKDYVGAISDYNMTIKLEPTYESYMNRGITKSLLGDHRGG